MAIKCSKCGKDGIFAKGLCKSCYNQFYYFNRNHNVQLQDYVQKDKQTFYHTELKHYDKFLKVYDPHTKQGIKALAKTIGISRETVYKYIRVYNGEEVNGKSKNKV